MGRGKTGLARYIEWSLKIVSCVVPAVEAASIALDTSLLDTTARAAGLLLGGAGTLVFMISVMTMGDSWRAGVPKEERTGLVTGAFIKSAGTPRFLGLTWYILELERCSSIGYCGPFPALGCFCSICRS